MADRVPVARRWGVAAFLLLTTATGLIDAVSYLTLNHTFVANMTGNVVFLGFALSPDSGFTVVAPLLSLTGFVFGSLVGGRTAALLDGRPRRWLGIVFGSQTLVLAVTTVLTLTLTGLAADSFLGGGKSARPHRRIGSVAAMFAGAAVGALLLQVITAGVIAVAALAVALAAAIFVFGPLQPEEQQEGVTAEPPVRG